MQFLGSIIGILLVVFLVSFVISAFCGWIAFFKDIHRFKSDCDFKGTRKQFLNYLFDKIVKEKEGEQVDTELSN